MPGSKRKVKDARLELELSEPEKDVCSIWMIPQKEGSEEQIGKVTVTSYYCVQKGREIEGRVYIKKVYNMEKDLKHAYVCCDQEVCLEGVEIGERLEVEHKLNLPKDHSIGFRKV